MMVNLWEDVKDTSRRKTPSKRFQNQITFYIRLIDSINLSVKDAIIENNVYKFEVPIGTCSNTMKLNLNNSYSKYNLSLKITIAEPKLRVPFVAFNSTICS